MFYKNELFDVVFEEYKTTIIKHLKKLYNEHKIVENLKSARIGWESKGLYKQLRRNRTQRNTDNDRQTE